MLAFASSAAIALTNAWVSARVIRAAHLSRGQVIAQVAVVWLLPIVGALLVMHFLQENAPTKRQEPWSSPEKINSQLEQVLRPMATGATKAARQQIEQDVVEHFSEHSSQHGGPD
jgi:hypothetical protein